VSPDGKAVAIPPTAPPATPTPSLGPGTAYRIEGVVVDEVGIPISDVCVETQSHPPAPYTSAALTCELTDNKAHPGRRLPTHDIATRSTRGKPTVWSSSSQLD